MKQFVVPVVLAALICVGIVSLSNKTPPPPELGKIASFEFENADGGTLRDENLAGKLAIWSFFFTSCQGPCPATQATVKKLQTELADLPNIEFVSLSIDPATDTPEVMRAYRAKLGGDGKNWALVRTAPGSPGLETFVVDSFRLGIDLKQLIHSTRLVLVDGKGSVRGTYESGSAEALERLKADIHAVLK